MSTLLEKLGRLQTELKAPKNQYNQFGKYHYRSCEDILEGLKPLLEREKCVLTIADNVELISDRFYIKAVVTLHDIESSEMICNTAFAREPLDKKGMDEPQITGTASSYARKYALNGLFCIDDVKDADANEYKTEQQNKEQSQKQKQKEYKCCECGKPFSGFTGKDGKKYNAGQAFHISEGMTIDGKARCGDCIKRTNTRKPKKENK